MEKFVRIKAKDGFTIHGTLNYSGRKPLAVCLFVHGLTGFRNEPLHINAVEPFNNARIATLRIDLYTTWQKNGRPFEKSTLMTHADDVNSSVLYLKRKGFKKIYGVGHSLGSTSILTANNQHFRALSLWDPSDDRLLKENALLYDKKLKTYFVKSTPLALAGTMAESLKDLPDVREIGGSLRTPAQIIVAGNGCLQSFCSELYERIPSKKSSLPSRMLAIVSMKQAALRGYMKQLLTGS